MKTLFLNMLPDAATYGHKLVDKKILHAMSSFSELHIIMPRKWFDIKEENVICKELKTYEGKTKASYYYMCIKNLMTAYKSDIKERYDKIVFATFDEYVMRLASKIFKNSSKRIYIIYRNNIDEIDNSPKKRFFFQRYCKRINHIVFEDFQKEHLICQYEIQPNKVFVLPYPTRDKIIASEEDKAAYDVVAISNSNNEDWIRRLIEIERKDEIIKKKNLQVVFRSKKTTFDNGFLHVVKGYMEPEIYNHYLYYAKTMFIPYPPSFKYRMSGVMIEAFSNYKRVIGSDIPLLQVYAKRYPEICRTVDTLEELIEEFYADISDKEKADAEFKKFEIDHSENVMKNALLKMLNLYNECTT